MLSAHTEAVVRRPNAAVARLAAEHEVIALDAAAPLADAARVMAEHHIGSVAVREGEEVVGLVTERDLVHDVLAKGGNASRPMREAMRPALRIAADASEADCAALMRDYATKHLLVQDGNRILGVVSMTDIIELMLEEKQSVIEQLNTYIAGY